VVNPLEFRREKFLGYIEDRRREPRQDILSDLANATYLDGSVPAVMYVVHVASLLFGAGQDTTAHLLGNALRILAEDAGLQDRLRGNLDGVPGFMEEVLRHSGPVKSTFRLAKKPLELAGVAIAPGTHVMIATAAANRDPRRFDDPAEFRPERANAKEHLSFGRGAHTCRARRWPAPKRASPSSGCSPGSRTFGSMMRSMAPPENGGSPTRPLTSSGR
jgi:cytochrome P450 family 150 subfamily A5